MSTAIPEIPEAPQSRRRLVPRRRRAYITLGVSATLFLLIVAVAVFAPAIAPHNPDRLFPNGLTPSGNPLGSTAEFPLGTDQFGRDELSRLLWGGRPALLISTLASVFSSVVGITLGTAAGYFGGWIDTVISRFVNILMSFPLTLFAVAIVLIVSPSVTNLIVIIAAIYWTYTARLVRAEVLTLREQEFISAAQAIGCSPWRLMVRHLMPNVLDTVIVRSVLTMAQVFLLESGLSYLGVGVQPPTPDWGLMIAQSQNYYGVDPGLVIYPGLAIVITVMTVTQLGESYRALKRRA